VYYKLSKFVFDGQFDTKLAGSGFETISVLGRYAHSFLLEPRFVNCRYDVIPGSSNRAVDQWRMETVTDERH